MGSGLPIPSIGKQQITALGWGTKSGKPLTSARGCDRWRNSTDFSSVFGKADLANGRLRDRKLNRVRRLSGLVSGGCGRQVAKTLGRDIECIVKFAGQVLEGDETSKLN